MTRLTLRPNGVGVPLRGALAGIVAVGTLTAVSAAALSTYLSLSAAFEWRVVMIFAAGSAVTVAALLHEQIGRPFGPANQVTLLRLGLVALLLGMGHPQSDIAAWSAVGIASVALILDGVDGWIARRTDSSSAFGARFDMETDALLILALALLVWQFDKAGVWVLVSGLARYVFVAATWIWRHLRAALPESRRRKVVCVVQVVTLLIALAPVVAVPISAAVALLGVVLLVASFAIDVLWLNRHAR